MLACIPSADLGGSSDYSVEIRRGLKRVRFPCEQYLDMGQSVLTPVEDHLGKVWEPFVRKCGWSHSLGSGGKGIRDKIPKPARGERPVISVAGEEASKQLTTVGRQGSLACGELSFLFDVAGALNIISGGERRLNT